MLATSLFGLPFITGTPNQVGALGEQLVASALYAAGWSVVHDHRIGDLTARQADRTLCVEVKTARENKRGEWCFTLYKEWQGRICANVALCDFVVLLCVRRSGLVVPFVVPGLALTARRAVTITSNPATYRGWLSQYRRRTICFEH